MWTKGFIGEYTYCILHFEKGSHYGIKSGRISKMSIRKNKKELYNYDRGLDFDNLDKKGQEIYSGLLEIFN